MKMKNGMLVKSEDSTQDVHRCMYIQHTKCTCTYKKYEDYIMTMRLKYDREWEPVYQAFLLHPLAQEVLASPERDNI